MTQAVVVGSGPNGLAAALVLARAGLSVTVLEAADTPGGGTRSAELTLPGLIHDECSGFHPLAVDNAFSRFAGLEDYGLEWAWPEVQYAHPLDGPGTDDAGQSRGGQVGTKQNGAGAATYRSVEETARHLGQDGARWAKIFGPLAERFGDITEDFLQPLLHVPHHPIKLARFGALAAMPAALVSKVWRTEEARALFAGVAAHAYRPFSSLMSAAIGTALGTAAHRWGWPVAVGGSASISDAMIAAIEDHGGKIETGVKVRSLSELDADVVMLDTAPAAAADLACDAMPSRVARGLRAFRHGPAAFVVNFAVEGGIPWKYAPASQAGTVHLGGTYQETAAVEAQIHRGVMPERPFVLLGQQYVADPARAVGHTVPIDAYAHVPAGYEGDATEAIERQIERFAPGFRERIVARSVRSAQAVQQHNPNYVGGDIITGANTARQLVFRPRVAVNPYSLGIPGVYICSAAAPPGAGAHGMAGYHAARAALRDM